MGSTNTVSLASIVSEKCSHSAGVARRRIKDLSQTLITGQVNPQNDPSGSVLGISLQSTADIGNA